MTMYNNNSIQGFNGIGSFIVEHKKKLIIGVGIAAIATTAFILFKNMKNKQAIAPTATTAKSNTSSIAI